MIGAGVVGVGVTGSLVVSLMARRGDIALTVFDPDAVATRRLTGSGVVAATRLGELTACAAVALCHPHAHHGSARRFLEDGVSVVSIADQLDDVTELLELDELARRRSATLVVGAGMAPGLSGLIARHLTGQLDVVEELHIAAHGTGGPECARHHHRSLGDRASGWHDGRWIERPGGSGRELCWFPEPIGAHDCYRAAMADPLLLHRAFPQVERISARTSATRRDRLTARLPMLTPPHSGGNIGAVRVEARGSLADGSRATVIAGASGRAEQLAASVCAATLEACVDGRLPHGLVALGDEAIEPAGLLLAAMAAGTRMQEFTGVARTTTW